MQRPECAVRHEDRVWYVTLNDLSERGTITTDLVTRLGQVLDECEPAGGVLVLQGSPEVFCLGADFHDVRHREGTERVGQAHPATLYDLWLRMATGPLVVVSHVRGRVNAGGVGFVCASDLVLADETATFSLSELLFGLYPAMVLPFLTRRIGRQRAHYLTLTTKPIAVRQAASWGLVDAYETNSTLLLRRHLARLTKIPGTGLRRYKQYASSIGQGLVADRATAVAANLEMFADEEVLARIDSFVESGRLPWEGRL